MTLFEIDLELRVFLKWLKEEHPDDWKLVNQDHLLLEYFDRLPKRKV